MSVILDKPRRAWWLGVKAAAAIAALIITAPATGHYHAPTTVDRAIHNEFPRREWARASRVAWCESRYDPRASNPSGASGIYQVIPRWHGPVPHTTWGQVRQAARIWRRAGWRPWTASKWCWT